MGLSEADVAWYLARRGWVDLFADFLSQPLFPKPPTPSKPPSRMSRATPKVSQRPRGTQLEAKPALWAGKLRTPYPGSPPVRILRQMDCVRVV